MVLVASRGIDSLIESMRRDFLPPRSVVTVLDPAFTVVLRSTNDEWVGKSIVGTDIQRWLESGKERTEHAVLTVTGLITDKRIHAYSTAKRASGEFQGYVVVSVPDEIYLRPLNRATMKNASYLLIILVVVSAAAWIGSDLLVLRRVNTLMAVARAITGGNYAARVSTTADEAGEFAELGHVFNDMATKVEADIAQIKTLNRTYAVLTAINSAILRIRERDVLLAEACQIAVTVGGYTAACIYSIEDDAKTVRLAAHAGARRDHFESLSVDLVAPLTPSSGPIARAVRTVQECVEQNVEADPERQWTQRVLEAGASAVAVFPLIYAGQVTEVFTFLSSRPEDFDAADSRLLKQVASDTALGLELIAKDLRIERLNRIYSMLTAATEAVVRMRDSHALSAEICRIIVSSGQFMSAAVLLLEHSRTGGLDLAGHAGKGRAVFESLSIGSDAALRASGSSPLARALASGHLVLERDVAAHAGTAWADQLLQFGAGGVAVLPMTIEQEVGGALMLWSAGADAFASEELELLSRLAADTAFGLEGIHTVSRLHQVSNFDALTGLPNRSLFEDRATQAFQRGVRRKRVAAILILRVARFHQINDNYGWSGGDAVLREIALALGQDVRAGDTVARLGDSEFGIVAADLSEVDDALTITNKVLGRVPHEVSWADGSIHVDFSLGVAVFPQDGANIKTLMRNAEFALNNLADEPLANFGFYSAALDREAHERRRMEAELRLAIERNELYVVYQPLVRISDRAIVGAEALVRWQSHAFGTVSPGRFIPLAEKAGLISDIGNWVMEKAAAQRRLWANEVSADFKLAVNVSVRQLNHPGFIEQVGETLAKAAVDPHALALCIEITESELMDDINRAIPILQQLKDYGLKLSIDDFGTGYSSMSYLRQLPIDTLKIDISFVQEVSTDTNARTIVNSIIKLAHSLRLDVVAEGVETNDQLIILAGLDCDTAQGYLFSKPVTADEFLRLLKS